MNAPTLPQADAETMGNASYINGRIGRRHDISLQAVLDNRDVEALAVALGEVILQA